MLDKKNTEKIINEMNAICNSSEMINVMIESFNKRTGMKLKSFNSFSASVLHNKEYRHIIKSLIELDNEDFALVLENVFDTCLFKNKQSDISSEKLSSLVIKLLELEAGDCVADFGSGKGGFIFNVYKYYKKIKRDYKDLYGIDIQQDNIDLCNATAFMLGAKFVEFRRANLLSNDSLNICGFNKGYCLPPFSLKDVSLNENKKTSLLFDDVAFSNPASEWVFIDKMLAETEWGWNNPKCVAIVPISRLFSYEDKEYRDSLLKSGKIEGIIELPIGALRYTSIKTAIIIFGKGSKQIKMLDASNIKNDIRARFSNFDLNSDDIYSAYKNARKYEIFELLKYDSLSPSNIEMKFKATKENGKELLSLCEDVFTGCQYTNKHFQTDFCKEKKGYRILTSGDIEDGGVDWNSLQLINPNYKLDKFALQKNDLVITSKSSKVKIAVFDSDTNEKIIVTGGMIIVRPNIKVLNPYYLKLYLDSFNGQIQLKSIQRGSIIITLTSDGTKHIIIPNKPINQQNEIAKKFVYELSNYHSLKTQLKKAEKRLSNFLNCEEND